MTVCDRADCIPEPGHQRVCLLGTGWINRAWALQTSLNRIPSFCCLSYILSLSFAFTFYFFKRQTPLSLLLTATGCLELSGRILASWILTIREIGIFKRIAIVYIHIHSFKQPSTHPKPTHPARTMGRRARAAALATAATLVASTSTTTGVYAQNKANTWDVTGSSGVSAQQLFRGQGGKVSLCLYFGPPVGESPKLNVNEMVNRSTFLTK